MFRYTWKTFCFSKTYLYYRCSWRCCLIRLRRFWLLLVRGASVLGGCPAMRQYEGLPSCGWLNILPFCFISAFCFPDSFDLRPKTHRKKDAKEQYNLNIISKFIIFKFIKQIILKIYLLINFYYIVWWPPVIIISYNFISWLDIKLY